MNDDDLALLRLKMNPETYSAIEPEEHTMLSPDDVFGAIEDLKRQKAARGDVADDVETLPAQTSKVNRGPAESYSAIEPDQAAPMPMPTPTSAANRVLLQKISGDSMGDAVLDELARQRMAKKAAPTAPSSGGYGGYLVTGKTSKGDKVIKLVK